MTALSQDPNYYDIDTPFTEGAEQYGWIETGHVYVPDDPMVVVQRRMMLVLGAAVFVVVLFAVWALRNTGSGEVAAEAIDTSIAATSDDDLVAAAPPAVEGAIAPLFTAEVQYWAPQIIAWSAAAGVDPNMAATVMQIESCGDPNAVSSAGAQGLFQVMPFHFDAGENMQDPDTNARRGLAYLALGMQQTSGDVGRSFAGYNGGHGTAARNWEAWPAETQRYYVWATGIYKDAAAGSASSETLNQWLAAGGAGLCRQAAARLGLQ